jgi:predicted homoserine dehydrogenase-like protein
MMEKDIINIALIGAGETGTPLLEQLLHAKFVNVVLVADLNSHTTGIQLAQTQGVRTTTNFMEVAQLGTEIDIIIEVTGVSNVKEQLRKYLHDTGNHHTIIMHEMIAILLMSLLRGQLVTMKHQQVDYD